MVSASDTGVYRQVFGIAHCSLGFASRRAVLGQNMTTGSADGEYVSIVFLVRFHFHSVTQYYRVVLREDYDLARSDCFGLDLCLLVMAQL